MIVGLTGGIATGKSTVASMLLERGARLVDADRIARQVVEPGEEGLDQVVRHFGNDVLQEDGTLNRKKLGSIIFADSAARKTLEGILHPLIRAEMRRQMEQYETEAPEQLVVVDVPLLFESGLQHMFPEVMLVYTPRAVQLERLMERDGMAEQEARRRLDAQLDIEQKKQWADIVIDNSGALAETVRQLERFWLDKGLR